MAVATRTNQFLNTPMKTDKTENEIPIAFEKTSAIADVNQIQKQLAKHEEQVPRKHPHGEDWEMPEQTPRTQPHEFTPPSDLYNTVPEMD